MSGSLAILATTAIAITHYVDLNSPNPTVPFTNWIIAATNIQDAVDAAVAGDEIVVSNGLYSIGGRAAGTNNLINRVTVDKSVMLRSVNGPAVTTIQGYQMSGITNGNGAIRCVYLTNGASLFGFTLTGGGTRTNGHYINDQCGGGLFCESATPVASNCVISANTCWNVGAGAYQGVLLGVAISGNSARFGGGGVSSCQLTNCWITNNATPNGGGGVSGGTLSGCTLSGNSSGIANGGGATSAKLINCLITGNSAGSGGGANNCALDNCTLIGNQASYQGGGAFGGLGKADLYRLNNCRVYSNSAPTGGGTYNCDLNNTEVYGNSAQQGGGIVFGLATGCTITSNSAAVRGGGAAGSGSGILKNCIVYYNQSPIASNYDGSTLSNCCTQPQPSTGFGNITNPPLFINLAEGDLTLQSNSPCVNSGNNSYMTNTIDLDGNLRIVGGTVDMGAHELQSAASVLSYVWAQQYGLPTDGSADFLDADGDGMNNWQEWRCQTNPTNALSVLRMLPPSRGISGMNVSWPNVSGRTYWLERATNLGAATAFSIIATNLTGGTGTKTYLDTNAVGQGPFLYRLGVQ